MECLVHRAGIMSARGRLTTELSCKAAERLCQLPRPVRRPGAIALRVDRLFDLPGRPIVRLGIYMCYAAPASLSALDRLSQLLSSCPSGSGLRTPLGS